MDKVKKLTTNGRAALAIAADYSEGSNIEKTIMAMIAKIATDNILASL